MSDIKQKISSTLTKNTTSEGNGSNKRDKILIRILFVTVIILIAIIAFKGCTRKYADPIDLFDKIDKEDGQEEITSDEPEAPKPSENQSELKNKVFLYSEELDATVSNGKVHKKVINFDESNQDMSVEFYVKTEELNEKLGKKSSLFKKDDEYFMIAKSGLIEPGYQKSEFNLIDFEDGMTLPKGTYNGTFKEIYYDHETGERTCLDGSLEITITVQ